MICKDWVVGFYVGADGFSPCTVLTNRSRALTLPVEVDVIGPDDVRLALESATKAYVAAVQQGQT